MKSILNNEQALQLAQVCHEANRAYCQTIGDSSQPPWSEAPEWQKESAMSGVLLHANNPNASASASHDAWMKQKLEDGWAWGAEKDPENKKHHCLVDFDTLPTEQQAKDYLFRNTVHALIEGLKLLG